MMLFAKSSTTKVETMCGDFCLSFQWHRSDQIHARKEDAGPDYGNLLIPDARRGIE